VLTKNLQGLLQALPPQRAQWPRRRPALLPGPFLAALTCVERRAVSRLWPERIIIRIAPRPATTETMHAPGSTMRDSP